MLKSKILAVASLATISLMGITTSFAATQTDFNSDLTNKEALLQVNTDLSVQFPSGSFTGAATFSARTVASLGKTVDATKYDEKTDAETLDISVKTKAGDIVDTVSAGSGMVLWYSNLGQYKDPVLLHVSTATGSDIMVFTGSNEAGTWKFTIPTAFNGTYKIVDSKTIGTSTTSNSMIDLLGGSTSTPAPATDPGVSVLSVNSGSGSDIIGATTASGETASGSTDGKGVIVGQRVTGSNGMLALILLALIVTIGGGIMIRKSA